jgi:membrane protein DedA with SNARE-associated domain
MPPALISYITTYGYLTIFSLVFLQEIGVPNPVPNELVLLFSGYLASIGKLSFVLVILTVVAADFIGTSLLYFVFYFIGQRILAKNYRWLPKEKIDRVIKRLSERGQWGIFVGRLIPYLRGYTSVAAGLLRIKPHVFLPVVLGSAITWSGGYAIAGRLLGNEYASFASKVSAWKIAVAGAALLVFIFFVVPRISRLIKKYKNINNS